MILTTYGYKKPEDNDTQFFDYLEFNLDRMDAHTHDGVDSPLIPACHNDSVKSASYCNPRLKVVPNLSLKSSPGS